MATAQRVAPSKEGVGKRFDLDKMRLASRQAWIAVEKMRAAFVPGLRESAAHRIARDIFDEIGVERIWHPTLIRFGANTTKTFRQKSDGDPVLGDDDIFFIDIGLVFDGHEADVGATFTTGSNRDMATCAAAVKSLFDDVSATWRHTGATGAELYAYAEKQAELLGWKLNLGVLGHRVSDFPHSIYRAGSLGAFESQPAEGIWVLEIQLRHPTKPYGAFYEDVLFRGAR
jgi:Xaa-Pro aminopeptidase